MADYGDNDIGVLGGAFKGFAQGMMDAEDRAYKKMEMTAKLTAQREDKERQRAEDEAKKQEKDYNKRKALFEASEKYDVPEGVTDVTQLQLNPKPSERYLKTLEARAAADPYGAKQAGALKARVEAGAALEEQRRKGVSPVVGFQKTANYVASPEEEKQIRSANADRLKFNTAMDGLISKVQSASKEELANPYSDVAKAVKNDLRDLQLVYKGDAFAKLGVLTGPDMAILSEIIENPGTVSNFISGKPGVLERYQQAKDRVNTGFNLRAESLGLVPVQQQSAPPPDPNGLIGKGLIRNAPGGLIKAAPSASSSAPKPGAIMDGYRFKGGDPADKKNWEKAN